MKELLVPAGNEESAITAIKSGADAIYLGLTAFSARASAENFDEEKLSRVLTLAHLYSVRVHVAMNISLKNAEVEEFLSTAVKVHNMGADAIIMQDIFLGKLLHEKYPEITLHLSTQAGTNNVYGARLAKEYGFSRVILSRETPIEDVQQIASMMETEVFVQGALCSCFSGQCYLSAFAGGNSGNRGRCKQPCRKVYSYDRPGYEKPAYALSLSDLSVGERIHEYILAGVVSFKIEGRMRRSEYVAAAVKYYRAILAGEEAKARLSDLKRTFNRGDYTSGLAFGQDKRFLSRSVQGHIGEKVGVIVVKNKRYFCDSRFLARKGDCFKILRKGKEVGGGTFEESAVKGFYLSTRARLVSGDSVFITTDTALNERLLAEQKSLPLRVSARFIEGEKPIISCEEFSFVGNDPLPSALSRPLTKEELIECLKKGEEFSVTVGEILLEGNIFLPKSALNELRRQFFAGVKQSREKKVTFYEAETISLPNLSAPSADRTKKRALISSVAENAPCDIFIFKPHDYQNQAEFEGLALLQAEKYLYLPPFLSSKDEKLVSEVLKYFDGVYSEAFWGIEYAKEKGKKLFAGAGFNAMNAFDIAALEKIADYFVLSKELSFAEAEELLSPKAFVLRAGDIKVMDLIYCPFEKTCSSCDKRARYTLTDENNRKFPVRRYEMSSCRFEVYNCASLVSEEIAANELFDCSVNGKGKELLSGNLSVPSLKKVFPEYTFGRTEKGVL